LLRKPLNSEFTSLGKGQATDWMPKSRSFVGEDEVARVGVELPRFGGQLLVLVS
jgi:hypothetical protein